MQICWVWRSVNTKREVGSGTKICLIWICDIWIMRHILIFWHKTIEFCRRYFDLWRQNLEIMSFQRWIEGEGGEGWGPGDFGIGVGKKYPGHPVSGRTSHVTAREVVKVQGEDPATPGCLREVRVRWCVGDFQLSFRAPLARSWRNPGTVHWFPNIGLIKQSNKHTMR